MVFEKENSKIIHKPVLLREAMEYLEPSRGGVFVDATLGLGGHAEAILTSSQSVKLIGIDQDAEALKRASERLQDFAERVNLAHANFAEIKQVLGSFDISQVDGILADLGVSSLQLEGEGRGFSFQRDEPLDMRMNREAETLTAAELLNTLSEQEIADLIFKYGEERFARRIAKKIVERRATGKPIQTTFELVELIEKAIGKRSGKIHSATRTFQALRIAVNRELENLEKFIFDAVDVLKIGGRLVLISFHSLEDRLIKHLFLKFAGRDDFPKRVEILTRKPVRPSEYEIKDNPRARSAKLRACMKI